MQQHWIIINKRGMRSIVFDFATAKEYMEKGYKVIFVAEKKEGTNNE